LPFFFFFLLTGKDTPPTQNSRFQIKFPTWIINVSSTLQHTKLHPPAIQAAMHPLLHSP
jgi:hypothetical protein